MWVIFFPSEGNPFYVIFLVLTGVHTYPNFILKASILCLIFIEEAVKVIDIIPQEMFLVNMIIELLVIFLQLNK